MSNVSTGRQEGEGLSGDQRGEPWRRGYETPPQGYPTSCRAAGTPLAHTRSPAVSKDENIPLLPAETLRQIRRTDKKLYRALGALCGRAAAQVVHEAPQDLLLWLYLTGISHGAAMERRAQRQTHP